MVLHKPIIDALLFSLAIAVGITPQLLPAVVSTSLATGSRRLARRKVLVKRLVCIEDLGDIDVLFTDKTGTLTAGPDRLHAGPRRHGRHRTRPLRLGLLCTEAVLASGHPVGGNPLDVALWDAPRPRPPSGDRRLPAPGHRSPSTTSDAWSRFWSATSDGSRTAGHQRRTRVGTGPLRRCPRRGTAALDAEFTAGNRVVAVATRAAPT